LNELSPILSSLIGKLNIFANHPFVLQFSSFVFQHSWRARREKKKRSIKKTVQKETRLCSEKELSQNKEKKISNQDKHHFKSFTRKHIKSKPTKAASRVRVSTTSQSSQLNEQINN